MLDCITQPALVYEGSCCKTAVADCITGGWFKGGGGIPPFSVVYLGIFHHKGYGILSNFDLKQEISCGIFVLKKEGNV